MKKILFFVILFFALPVLAGELDPNDQLEFRALVGCLSEAKTSFNNSNVCVAPIIYIMSGLESKWFSVTGAEIGDVNSL
jgi:hypothetical protein